MALPLVLGDSAQDGETPQTRWVMFFCEIFHQHMIRVLAEASVPSKLLDSNSRPASWMLG
jgi:hypothetical protein